MRSYAGVVVLNSVILQCNFQAGFLGFIIRGHHFIASDCGSWCAPKGVFLAQRWANWAKNKCLLLGRISSWAQWGTLSGKQARDGPVSLSLVHLTFHRFISCFCFICSFIESQDKGVWEMDNKSFWISGHFSALGELRCGFFFSWWVGNGSFWKNWGGGNEILAVAPFALYFWNVTYHIWGATWFDITVLCLAIKS